MKPIIILLLFQLSVDAQKMTTQGAVLKIEWSIEVNIPGDKEVITGILTNGHSIYYSLQNNQGSGIFAQSNDNSSAPVPIITKSPVKSLQVYNGELFSMGGCQLTRRDLQGHPQTEICLQLQESWNLSAVEGCINEGTVYGLHWANMLAAYDIKGQLKWSRQISELSENRFLELGGAHLYVLANIVKPTSSTRLMQFDSFGEQKWSVVTGDVHAMVADNAGNCYIMVANGETTVIKYNSAGHVVWSKLLSGQYAQGASILGDSLFICGNISLNAITDKNQSCAFSVLSASSGDILHQQIVDLYEDPNEAEKMTQISSDSKAIYIGGSHGNQFPKCFIVKFSREGSTGLKNEKELGPVFEIYPNPTSNKFTIACNDSGSEKLNIRVLNTLGQVVLSKEIKCDGKKTWDLDLGRQASGTYTVEIVSGSDKVTKQLVID
jgi:hypothetical protein